MAEHATPAQAGRPAAQVAPAPGPWRDRLLFALMALIWGTTWIAIKAGVTAVPPVLFAGTRFTAAGLLLLGWLALRGALRPVPRRDWPAVAGVAGLIIVATYGLLFWGVRHAPSGLAGVINLAVMPVALLGLGLLHGEERWRGALGLAVAVGVLGLGVLFRPTLAVEAAAGVHWGLLAVVGGTLAYAWGSVLNRRLLRRYAAPQLAALQVLGGGVALTALALGVEPVDSATWRAFGAPAVLAGWLFLVLGGSLAAFTIYLHLVHTWSATRAGMYAFVSPVVALACGAVVYGEALTPGNLAGSALVLAAAWLALRRA